MKNSKSKLKVAIISGFFYGLTVLGFDLLLGKEIKILKFIISPLIFAFLMTFVFKTKVKNNESENQNM